MNRESSRSHCVLIATIRTERITSSGVRNVRTSQLNLVDLAGSEQHGSSGPSRMRLKEASNINKSLSLLGRVITSLAHQQRVRVVPAHSPYRDSKLTFLLQVSSPLSSPSCLVLGLPTAWVLPGLLPDCTLISGVCRWNIECLCCEEICSTFGLIAYCFCYMTIHTSSRNCSPCYVRFNICRHRVQISCRIPWEATPKR